MLSVTSATWQRTHFILANVGGAHVGLFSPKDDRPPAVLIIGDADSGEEEDVAVLSATGQYCGHVLWI